MHDYKLWKNKQIDHIAIWSKLDKHWVIVVLISPCCFYQLSGWNAWWIHLKDHEITLKTRWHSVLLWYLIGELRKVCKYHSYMWARNNICLYCYRKAANALSTKSSIFAKYCHMALPRSVSQITPLESNTIFQINSIVTFLQKKVK